MKTAEEVRKVQTVALKESLFEKCEKLTEEIYEFAKDNPNVKCYPFDDYMSPILRAALATKGYKIEEKSGVRNGAVVSWYEIIW